MSCGAARLTGFHPTGRVSLAGVSSVHTYHGRVPRIDPSCIVTVHAETRGKAKAEIHRMAQEAYRDARFTDVQVRRGESPGYWLEREASA